MPKDRLTENVEMYLKTIFLLEVETKAPARTGKISELLNISPASVTEMLDRLHEVGYVKHKRYKGVSTTGKGKQVARAVIRKHCLLERFLMEALGVKDKATAHQQADAMEHVLRNDIAMRLRRVVKVPEECPECYDLGSEICRKLLPRRPTKRHAR